MKKKIGFTCGVFDLFHAGHALMLKECKENCDFLVVGLNSAKSLEKNKNLPLYSLEEREIILKSIKFVDEVIIYNSEEELIFLLNNRQFDIRFLGDDYYKKSITSKESIKIIYYINRDHGFSSSRIRERIKCLLKKEINN